MIRLRSCFEVTGNARFLSHLDMLKVMERALRRANISVAFSEGFNPHPKIAFGSARAVGLSSTCEYFDVDIKEDINPEEYKNKLQDSLPTGIAIKETRKVSTNVSALMAVLNCATYQVILKTSSDLTQKDLDELVEKFFTKEEVIVERNSPKGRKQLDIRPGVFHIKTKLDENNINLEIEVMSGSTGNIRPHEVIHALGMGDAEIISITRTDLFIRNGAGQKNNPY